MNARAIVAAGGLATLLAGCGLFGPPGGTGEAWVRPGAPQPRSETESLLAYFEYVRRIPPAELAREVDAARNSYAASRTDFNRVRFAIAIGMPANAADVEARMRALRMVGVPYTDEEIGKAKAELQGKSEMDALIAYLQVLGTALKPGDVVVLPADSYYTTRVLASTWLKAIGVEARLAPTRGDAQAGALRPAATDHFSNHHAADPPALCHRIRHERYPEPRPDELAVLDQLRDDAIDSVDRYGKTDSGKSPARAHNLGIHADQAAGAVEQGPSGISWIDSGIGLNNPLNRPI